MPRKGKPLQPAPDVANNVEPLVAFVRGANVGGHKTFRPAAVAKTLSNLGAANIGTAGTFVLRTPGTREHAHASICAAFPFQAHVILCRANELLDLPAPIAQPADDTFERQPFLTALAATPASLPRLPTRYPDNPDWQVEIVAGHGLLVTSIWRRVGTRLIYPNQAIEKLFGVSATTRNWNTLLAIRKALLAC